MISTINIPQIHRPRLAALADAQVTTALSQVTALLSKLRQEIHIPKPSTKLINFLVFFRTLN